MGWTKGTDGVYSNFSTIGNRVAYSSNVPQPVNFSQSIQCATTAHEIKLFAFSSYDGRSCYEAGVSGSDVVIRKVQYGTTFTNLAGPSAHGISSGVPFSMEMRVEDRTIKLYLNESTTPILTYTIAASGEFVSYRGYGFVCQTPVGSEKVLSWRVCELVPSISVRENMLWIVGGGTVYVSFDGTTAREVARGVCKETGVVSLKEYRQKLYLVDGAKAKVIDPVNFTVSDWTATSGALPGYTTAGTSNMYALEPHWGRVMGVSSSDPANVNASALNDALNWDTGADDSGRAFTFVTARVNMSGQTIRGLLSASSNRLLIGCASSMWQLMGDPSRGQVQLDQRSTNVGISGQNSMVLTDDDVVVFHGPMGFYRMVQGSTPQPISSSVLYQYIQFPPSERPLYTVTVIRDPTRKGVLICMTKDSDSIHLWYDELIGGWGENPGGFFPISFPASHNPTCAAYYDGQLLLGCSDGYVRKCDDSSATDDGTAIESRVYLERVDAAYPREMDTTLERLYVTMIADSAPVNVRVWRGQSPQQVYSTVSRSMAYSTEMSFGSPAMAMRVRAPSVAVELYASSGRWAIEEVEVKAFATMMASRHSYVAVPAPPTSTVPTGAGTGPPAIPPFDNGPGGGTGTSPTTGPTGPIIVIPAGSSVIAGVGPVES